MAEPEAKNCSRVFFFGYRIILMTNSNFQTPLTLSTHKSGLKNYSNKNYHIFRTGRTSASIWHPRIPLENFCIGVISKNAKKIPFLPIFRVPTVKKVRGRCSDNFEASLF